MDYHLPSGTEAIINQKKGTYHMKKRVLAILAAMVLVTAAGCSGKSDTSGSKSTSTTEKTVSSTVSEESTARQENSGSQTSGTDTGEDTVTAVTLSANQQNGQMTIARPQAKNTKMGEKDTWTIFVYMCGTDLETNIAAATGDVQQMLEAKGNDKVKFVIQTGGTKTWNNEMFNAEKAERYVVTNQDITNVGSEELVSMGDSDNLKNFLQWGVATYPADKMGVIFWDHGSGSINGVCFDELHEKDSLTLKEIDKAFSEVYAGMTDSFEFIGLDACLMGTIETANVLATYARYMYASQECEPGSGWDYTTFGTYLAEHPEADGAALGKVITDSFYDECKAIEQENNCTLTVVDLKKVDDFMIAFNDYAYQLYNAAPDHFSGIVKGVNGAENFGGNNKSEGYTNMVDIGGIVENCDAYADGKNVLKTLKDCITYNKNGDGHKNASGLSLYYPLYVEGSEELKIFADVCTSPYYLSLVDMVARGYSEEAYSNEQLFDENGQWVSTENVSDDYFNYADEEPGDEESPVIKFAEGPALDAEGNYGFVLDKESLDYAVSVEAYIFMSVEDAYLELGETYDINADWETGTFYDNFDGYWFSLPNGTLLATYIVDNDEDYAVYTAPINLNGKRTNLRIIVDDDGAYIEGAWDGIDENGFAAREIKQLKAGDKIEALYYIESEEESDTYTANAYTWQKDDNVTYTYLPAADYGYKFYVKDVYGDYRSTDSVIFTIDENGDIFFTEPEAE